MPATINAERQVPTHTGDVTGATATTLANVPITATFASNLTAVPLNKGGWSEFKVSGSNATTTGQVLVDITGLVTGTLSNAALYEIEAVLLVNTSAVTTGTQYAIFGGGSGGVATCNAICDGALGATTSASVGMNAIATATTAFLTTASQQGIVRIRGFVTTRGTGTATISLQHLKVTSGTSTVLIGSVLRIRKV